MDKVNERHTFSSSPLRLPLFFRLLSLSLSLSFSPFDFFWKERAYKVPDAVNFRARAISPKCTLTSAEYSDGFCKREGNVKRGKEKKGASKTERSCWLKKDGIPF